MKVPFRVLCLVLLLAGGGQAETRVFTDSSTGRTISAEVVSARAGDVTLKLESGAMHTILISRLCEADQIYVNGWISSHPSAAQPAPAVAPTTPAPTANISTPVDFKVVWSKDRQGAKARAKDDPAPIVLAGGSIVVGGVAVENWLCHLKITNPTRTPLANVVVAYKIHTKNSTKDAHAPRKGSINIPLINAVQSVNVDTSVFQLHGVPQQHYSTQQGSQGRNTLVSTYRTLELEEISGVELVFSQNGKEIGKYTSPGLK
jgi:hypothetical protein